MSPSLKAHEVEFFTEINLGKESSIRCTVKVPSVGFEEYMRDPKKF